MVYVRTQCSYWCIAAPNFLSIWERKKKKEAFQDETFVNIQCGVFGGPVVQTVWSLQLLKMLSRSTINNKQSAWAQTHMRVHTHARTHTNLWTCIMYLGQGRLGWRFHHHVAQRRCCLRRKNPSRNRVAACGPALGHCSAGCWSWSSHSNGLSHLTELSF